MAKALSLVSFNGALTVMFLILSTSMEGAKGECERATGVLDKEADAACNFSNEFTDLCEAYCLRETRNACRGRCEDKKCKCIPTCGNLVPLKSVPVKRPFSYVTELVCRVKDGAKICDLRCKELSGGNCIGRCTSEDASGCNCFPPN